MPSNIYISIYIVKFVQECRYKKCKYALFYGQCVLVVLISQIFRISCLPYYCNYILHAVSLSLSQILVKHYLFVLAFFLSLLWDRLSLLLFFFALTFLYIFVSHFEKTYNEFLVPLLTIFK